MPKVKKIYMWVGGSEKQIWPAGYQPGANTVAYYPLTSTTTVNDQSGNNRNLTNSNVSFGTQFGVDCAYISGNADSLHSVTKYLYGNITGLPTGSSARTYSFWIYNDNVSVPSVADDMYIFQGQASTNKMVFVQGGGVDGSGLRISQRGTQGAFGASVRKQRCHNVITYDGTKFEWCVNGVSRGTWTYTINTGSNKFSVFGASENPAWNGFNGAMSELILEDKARTATEVTDYYNLTKSNYGVGESQASSCFLAGTPVLIEGGSKPIDELNIGDAVLSYNKSTGEKEYNKVVDTIEHTETKDLLYTLDIEGQKVEATEFHKFYISDNKENWRWEEIRNLKEGQFVFSIGGAKKINSVESKKFDGPCYNITVENNHNYFVYDGILVHNAVSVS